jgi:microcystin-dependent protein
MSSIDINESLFVTMSNRVGVGIAEPLETMDVNGVLNLRGGYVSQEASSGTAMVDPENRSNTYIRFGPAGAASDWAYLRQIGTTNAMHLSLDYFDDADDGLFSIRRLQSHNITPDVSTTLFTVGASGRVGINTSTPAFALDVNGETHTESSLLVGNTTNNSGTLRFTTSGGSCYIQAGSNDTSASVTKLRFAQMKNTATTMTVDVNTQRVGIGTTEPAYPLDVNGIIRCTDIIVTGGSGTTFVTGMIIMWSGASSAIPTGWRLCDGTNGTPNLTNRFVVGAGGAYAVGSNGGSATKTLSVAEMPTHSHTINDSGHTHGNKGYWSVQSGVGGGAQAVANNTFSDYTDPGNTNILFSETTGITVNNAGSSNSFDMRPPFYALCYIMKT